MASQDDLERRLMDLGSLIASDPSIVDQAARRISESSVPPKPRSQWSRGYRFVAIVTFLAICVGAVGLTATHAGQELIHWVFTPVRKMHTVTWQSPVKTTTQKSPDGGQAEIVVNTMTFVTADRPEPFSDEEAAQVRARLQAVQQIAEAGGGRLVGLSEGLDRDDKYFVVHIVDYVLSDGKFERQATQANDKQTRNMRLGEIMQLRDSGAGEVISRKDDSRGLGQFVIRFTLSDGQTVDLETRYPPGTRQEREAMFAETRRLKAQRRFSVDNACAYGDGFVSAVLRYTLADGRVIGMSEQIPAEWLSADKNFLVTPDTGKPVAIENAGKR